MISQLRQSGMLDAVKLIQAGYVSATAREDRARNLVRAFGLLITASEVIVCDYSKAIRMLWVRMWLRCGYGLISAVW